MSKRIPGHIPDVHPRISRINIAHATSGSIYSALLRPHWIEHPRFKCLPLFPHLDGDELQRRRWALYGGIGIATTTSFCGRTRSGRYRRRYHVAARSFNVAFTTGQHMSSVVAVRAVSGPFLRQGMDEIPVVPDKLRGKFGIVLDPFVLVREVDEVIQPHVPQRFGMRTPAVRTCAACASTPSRRLPSMMTADV
ncbi:hypothetical protein GCM10023238_07910 [Streptomyces heliomycini]